MGHELCHRFGFTEAARKQRLKLLALSTKDSRWSEVLLRQVVEPNAANIVASFYDHMLQSEEFTHIVNRDSTLERLRKTQTLYLLSLGQEFATADYFEERLRVGVTHARVGVPLSLYECAYAVMKQKVIDAFPTGIIQDSTQFAGLTSFLSRVIALDMSLAIETYHLSKVQTLEKALQSLAQLDAELRHKVATDALTGVASHGQSLSALRKAIQLAHRNHTPLCIAMVDLDHFKRVNDEHGHQVGDDVLCDVAGRMQAAVRNFDTVGRYGGEEFLIILDNADLATAQEIAERVRQRVASAPVKTRSAGVNITLSLGLARLEPGDDVDSLIKRADEALYSAKHQGRNRVIYSSTISRPATGGWIKH